MEAEPEKSLFLSTQLIVQLGTCVPEGNCVSARRQITKGHTMDGIFIYVVAEAEA